MSVKIMGQAWDLKLSPSKLLILLAIADHSNHDGTNAYPSVEMVAWKTGYSESQVRRIIRNLMTDGIVSSTPRPGKSNLYAIHMDKGIQKPPFQRKGSQNDTPTPVKMTPPEVVTGVSSHGEGGSTGGVIAVTPEPSFEPLDKKKISRPQDVRALKVVGGEDIKVVEEGDKKSKSFTALEQQIMSANKARSMKTNLSRKLDTPIASYKDGKPVQSPSPNTLYMSDDLFPEFVTVLITNEIERFSHSSSKLPPSRDHLVNMICDYSAPTGWLAFKERHHKKAAPASISQATASGSFLDSLMEKK